MSDSLIHTPENIVADFFEKCAVTRIDQDRIELVVLEGENYPNGRRRSIALGSLALPADKAECDFELSQRADQLHDGLFPARYIAIGELTTEQSASLAIGKVVHWHQHTDGKELCISPEQIDTDQIHSTIRQQYEDRNTRIRKHIAQLTETAFYAKTTLERLQPHEPYFPFEKAEIRHREDGTEYIYVPDCLLVSERWGPRRLEFIARILPLAQSDYDPTVETLFTAEGHRYQIHAHQPYSTDKQSEPERFVKIEVVSSAPLGHQKVHEEQKLEMWVNGVAYWATYDEEHFFLTRHDPSYEISYAMGMLDQEDLDYIMKYETTGRPNILYSRFNPVHDQQPNVLDATDDTEHPTPTSISYMAHIVVPFDLELLREICIEFPGI